MLRRLLQANFTIEDQKPDRLSATLSLVCRLQPSSHEMAPWLEALPTCIRGCKASTTPSKSLSCTAEWHWLRRNLHHSALSRNYPRGSDKDKPVRSLTCTRVRQQGWELPLSENRLLTSSSKTSTVPNSSKSKQQYSRAKLHWTNVQLEGDFELSFCSKSY